MYLFFDTETTGLPSDWQAPVSHSDNWPRLVQLAWAWYDKDGGQWDSYNYIIYPHDFIIPEEASKIHRISQSLAKEKGQDLKEVLDFFSQQVSQADYVVAHNISFDEKIIGAEFFRLQKKDLLAETKKICTMRTTVEFCRLPNSRGSYKWPNLSELYYHLFNEELKDAHDALVDVLACARCFFALKKRNFKF